MRYFFVLLSLIFCLASKAQNDTILFTSFDSIATDAQNNIVVGVTNQLDMAGWGSLSWLAADLNTDIPDPSSQWYEEDLWKQWHKFPYIEAIDTTVNGQTTTYDTIVNVGLRSFSWFNTPDQALSVLLSPPVWMGDNTGKLKWKSMPIQGPRYQDGYKVFVLKGNNHEVFTTDPSLLTPDFEMKEMDNTGGNPSPNDSSLADLMANYGFVPANGTDHTRYTLPAPTGSGLVDSSRQNAFMQEFELDLSAHTGYIQVMFFHDSHDDNGMFLDDILITGKPGFGGIGINDIDYKSVAVFPNPASDHITIDVEATSSYQFVNVYTTTGKLVKRINALNTRHGQLTFGVSDLTVGVYQVEVVSDLGRFYSKFTKK